MRDERSQRREVLVGERLDAGFLMKLASEGPCHLKTLAAHHGVDLDQVRAHLSRAALGRRFLGRRAQQGIGREAAIDLTEVVEGDLGLRKGSQLAADFDVGIQVTQQAKADAVARDRRQLRLD